MPQYIESTFTQIQAPPTAAATADMAPTAGTAPTDGRYGRVKCTQAAYMSYSYLTIDYS